MGRRIFHSLFQIFPFAKYFGHAGIKNGDPLLITPHLQSF